MFCIASLGVLAYFIRRYLLCDLRIKACTELLLVLLLQTVFEELLNDCTVNFYVVATLCESYGAVYSSLCVDRGLFFLAFYAA